MSEINKIYALIALLWKEGYQWNTKSGWFKFNLIILALWLLFGNLIPQLFEAFPRLQSSTLLIKFLFLALPLLIYNFLYFFNRSWMKLRYTKKLNIVIAYNIEDSESLRKNYLKKTTALENEIKYSNLGDKICVIVRPTDINFQNNSAAETKTTLGLQGSVLLIWGYIYKERRGVKCKTKFSYEFSHPSSIEREKAIEIFNSYVEKYIGTNLFLLDSSVDFSTGTFVENILSTTLFIFGITNSTMGEGEENTIFSLEEFIRRFNTNTDIFRKRELGPALVEVKLTLVDFYLRKIGKLNERPSKNLQKAKIFAEKILKIDENNYFAYNQLAYYYQDAENNLTMAERYNELAGKNRKSKQHEYFFNKAFFEAKRGEYIKAIEIYDGLPSATNVSTTHLREFLYKSFEKTNDFIFLFLEAYVVKKWEDESEGIIIINRFLENVPDLPKYEILTRKARELL